MDTQGKKGGQPKATWQITVEAETNSMQQNLWHNRQVQLYQFQEFSAQSLLSRADTIGYAGWVFNFAPDRKKKNPESLL